MAKPPKTSTRPIGKRVEQFTHRASERLSSEVEKIVYKVMTNPGLENTVSNAIQKGLITLIVRYWPLVGLGVLLLLIAHAAILAVVLALVLKTN
ncbi:MAG: hypothetical protein NZ772_09705 [Cyanobacteria bacterium]|nr:hypothetical protein [Cyanobacteriota bacterium]MDW8201769.1 hypothetical protein [Cyanobacteriota bacterium SKYGB_h_bin112]